MVDHPGVVNVAVMNPGGASTATLPFTVRAPTISSIAPSSVPVGSAAFSLTVSGSNFAPGSLIVFNGTALSTSVPESGGLVATVPSTLLGVAGVVNVVVVNLAEVATSPVPFTVLSPSIGSLSPTSVLAGSPAFTLRVNGANFVPASQVLFDGVALSTVFGSAGVLNATVPANLVATPKVASIAVANPGTAGNLTAGFPFTVINPSPLTITTTSLGAGVSGANYTAVLTAAGGAPPYRWSATGVPPALFLDPATGVLSGALQASGAYNVVVQVKDSSGATVTATFSLVVSDPPLSITPSSAALPNGTVGVDYVAFVTATGGTEPYKFTLGGGSLPDGLTLSTSGGIFGKPKTPGRFTFVVVVTDAHGDTGSRDTSITIQPAPLTLTASTPDPPAVAGKPTSVTFTASGGVGPYRFTPCAALPPGMTFSDGVLSGTPATAGTFTVCLVLADSTGATITRNSR